VTGGSFQIPLLSESLFPLSAVTSRTGWVAGVTATLLSISP
jgi:hypothetical protein